MTPPSPYSLAEVYPGLELTPDQIEFGRAMDRYQRKFRRRYPAWSEVLYVAHCLGYRRTAAPREFQEIPPCSDSPSSACFRNAA